MAGAAKGYALYDELASWWPLLSPPAEYEEESGTYLRVILDNAPLRPSSLLELGSGGGNNASFLKKSFALTLVDLSEGMLEVSRALNPECEHILGDMRDVRLGRTFGAVLIQDAVSYMATREDLAKAVATAFVHCRPGGVALFTPDETAETFSPGTAHGGTDKGGRGLRYLEWTVDPGPDDERYSVFMTYMLREEGRVRQARMDEHVCGLFSASTWMETIAAAGFEPRKLPFEHSSFEGREAYLFMGIRPLAA